MSWSDTDKLEALLPADEPLRLSGRISLLEPADNFPTGISDSPNAVLLVGLGFQQHLKGPLVFPDGILCCMQRHFPAGSDGWAREPAQLMVKLVLPPRQTGLSLLISCRSASTNWRPSFFSAFLPSTLQIGGFPSLPSLPSPGRRVPRVQPPGPPRGAAAARPCSRAGRGACRLRWGASPGRARVRQSRRSLRFPTPTISACFKISTV